MASQTQAAVRGYLEKLQQECQEKQYTILQAGKLAVAEQLQAEPYEVQISFLKTAFGQAADLSPFQRTGGETGLVGMLSGLLNSKPAGRRLNWLEFKALGQCGLQPSARKACIPPEGSRRDRSFCRRQSPANPPLIFLGPTCWRSRIRGAVGRNRIGYGEAEGSTGSRHSPYQFQRKSQAHREDPSLPHTGRRRAT